MVPKNTSNSNTSESDTTGVPNSPEIGADGVPRVRAINDVGQLGELVKKFVKENEERNTKNARVMAKYNAERPHKPKDLKDEGLDWMSNFSSQPLATLIERVSPRFPRALHSARYLTSAKLPEHVKDAAKKTEVFRKEFTNLVRNRSEWKDLVDEIAQEDTLFGYTSVTHTDTTSWFPRHFRQDEFFVPAGTKQNSKFCPIYIAKEPFLPHELFEKISNRDAAEQVGWITDAVVDAINKAAPEKDAKTTAESARKYEDLYRESNLYSSFATGAKVIVVYHIFVVEITGKVSHYMIEGSGYKLIFESEDRYESMSQVTNFFSYQQANGKLMGSKGVGRTVYALAGIVDRARNEVVNRLQLSGKLIIQGDAKQIPSFKMSVIGQAIVISKAFNLVQQKIDAGVEPFMDLDNWVTRLMDEIAGNISPAAVADTLQGERVTNGQVNYVADLQSEAKDSKIERFLVQAASMLSEMQRRASSPDCTEDDAKEFRERCLLVMSEEEFEAISKHPAAGVVDDFTETKRQQIIQACTEATGDPMFDQKEVRRLKYAALVDPDFPDTVLLPQNDPTVQAEQTRQQSIENLVLRLGSADAVPPSPRDDHLIHLGVLMQDAQDVAGSVANDPSNATKLQNYVKHGAAHVQLAEQQGILPAQLQPYVEQLQKIQQGLQQIASAAQQAQATAGPDQSANSTPAAA